MVSVPPMDTVVGEKEVTDGATEKDLALVAVPPAVVTEMVPLADPDGTVTVIGGRRVGGDDRRGPGEGHRRGPSQVHPGDGHR